MTFNVSTQRTTLQVHNSKYTPQLTGHYKTQVNIQDYKIQYQVSLLSLHCKSNLSHRSHSGCGCGAQKHSDGQNMNERTVVFIGLSKAVELE